MSGPQLQLALGDAAEQNFAGDERARQLAATDLTHSYCIEAAAGTGKTTLLVARLMTIITSGEADLADVVAITFTRKAAAELEIRLREELERSRQKAAEPELTRIATALEQLDRANISTIHSFAASLLRERPVEAGVDPGFEELDEMSGELLFEEVWKSWKERQMGLAPAVLSRLLALEISLDSVVRNAAAKLYENRDLLDTVEVVANPVNELWRDIESKIKQLVALRSFCSDGDRGGQQIDRLAELLHGTGEDELDRERAILLDLEVSLNSGSNANWHTAEANQRQKKICADLRTLRESAAARLGPSLVSATILWLKSFLDELEATKRTRGQLDFQDLLLKARDLVRDHREVREHFQKRIKFLLVDEFQDTDPLQAELVFYLAEQRPEAASWEQARIKPGKLMLVGDPKQSIYKFRRADIQIYSKAKSAVSANGEPLVIQKNFRSAPAVLSSVNRLFEAQMKACEHQASYVSLLPAEGRHYAGPGMAMLFPPKEYEPGSMSAYRETEAELIARFIHAACDARTAASEPSASGAYSPDGLNEICVFDKRTKSVRRPQPRDIAVLFPTTTGLEFYEDALHDAGVPFQLDAGKQFYTRREIRALIPVLKAIDDPESAIDVVAALRSPLLGMSDDDLFLHSENGGRFHPLAPGKQGWERANQALGHLREWHGLRAELSVSGLIERVLSATSALQFFALLRNGEQAVANLLRIADLARTFESKPGASLRSFVGWIERRQDAELAEAETAMRDDDENAVQMLTIHAAKGLEFPIVILANLASSDRKTQNFYINHSQRQIALRIGSSMASANFATMAEDDKQRSRAEDLRLLYVGVTRAKDCIVIPRLAPKKIGEARFLDFFSAWADSFGERPERTVRNQDGSALLVVAEDLPKNSELKSRPRIDFRTPVTDDQVSDILRERDSWRQELSALGVGSSSTPASDAGSAGISNLSVALGTAFHRVMAAIDLVPQKTASTSDRVSAAQLATDETVKRIAREENVDERILADWVAKTLACEVIGRAAGASRLWRELPFCMVQEGRAVEGSIDLLFEDQDGKFVLVDYKTDSAVGESLYEAAERHRPQLESYARAVEAVAGKAPGEVLVLFARLGTAVDLARR